MNKDELRKEATTTVEWECTLMIDRPTFINGYITSAEPREKRIADLEKENAELKAANKKISDECHKLVDSFEKKQNENELLETQNIKLQAEVSRLTIKNAELRNRNQELLESCEGATMMYKDLCNAKEIIKTFLGFAEAFGYSPSMDKFITEAEQFIKENSTYERIRKAKYNYAD